MELDTEQLDVDTPDIRLDVILQLVLVPLQHLLNKIRPMGRPTLTKGRSLELHGHFIRTSKIRSKDTETNPTPEDRDGQHVRRQR